MRRRQSRLLSALGATCLLASGSTVDAVSGPLSFKLSKAGGLTISGVPSGNIELTGTANDQLNVEEGGVSLGTFAVTRDLKVDLGDVGGPLTVTADLGGFTMSGSWRITVGDATPGVSLTLGRGAILGSVKIKTGTAPIP
jgi:hypothetical protein